MLAPDRAQPEASAPAVAPYRQSLSQLGVKLGSSDKADFFAAQPGQALKLYRHTVPAVEVERYTQIACRIHDAGLASPAVDPRTVSVPDGRRGMLMRWFDAPTMAEHMAAFPLRIREHARMVADTHRGFLRVGRIAGLRSQRHDLTEKLTIVQDITERQRERVFALMNALPEGEQLCHGDFHCLNLLIAPDGPRIIDWDDASFGNPLADIARSWLVMRFSADRGWMERNYIAAMAWCYFREIFRALPGSREEVETWSLICGAARLVEDLRPRERACLVRHVRGHRLLKGF